MMGLSILAFIGITIGIISALFYKSKTKIKIKFPKFSKKPRGASTSISTTASSGKNKRDKVEITNIIATAIIIIILLTAALWVTSWFRGCDRVRTKEASHTETKKPKESEEKVFDGTTPCSPVINFKFRIETFGEPIYEKFTGVSEKFFFDGKNDPGTPAGAKGGPVSIKSANPNKPHVRVVVYKINK